MKKKCLSVWEPDRVNLRFHSVLHMTDEQNFQVGGDSAEVFIPPPPANGSGVVNEEIAKTKISIEAVAKVSLLVALIGSFLPWARVFFVTVNGTDGDGIITAILSSIALFLIYGSKRALVREKTGQVQLGFAVLCAALTAAVYIYDFVNLTSLTDESPNEFFEITVQPQIGIIVGSIGAVVGTIASSMIWNKRRNPKPVVVEYPTKSKKQNHFLC